MIKLTHNQERAFLLAVHAKLGRSKILFKITAIYFTLNLQQLNFSQFNLVLIKVGKLYKNWFFDVTLYYKSLNVQNEIDISYTSAM